MILLLDLDEMLLERPVAKETEKNYRRAIRTFSVFVQREATREDLQERLVNQFLASIVDRSPATVKAYKDGITILWNWLAEQDFVKPYDPRRLRKIREEVQPPRPFSLDQVQQLLAAAATLTHRCNHGTAAEMMRAWILLAYETGLRGGDLRRLTPEDLKSDVLTIAQNKTSQPHSFRVSRLARQALEPVLAAGQKTIFPPTKYAMDRWNKRLIKAAESLGLTRRKRQGIGTLRKTHGTEICRTHGLEAAAQSLGHVSGTKIARKYYVEPDAICIPPTPPSVLSLDCHADDACGNRGVGPEHYRPRAAAPQ